MRLLSSPASECLAQLLERENPTYADPGYRPGGSIDVRGCSEREIPYKGCVQNQLAGSLWSGFDCCRRRVYYWSRCEIGIQRAIRMCYCQRIGRGKYAAAVLIGGACPDPYLFNESQCDDSFSRNVGCSKLRRNKPLNASFDDLFMFD